MAHARQAHNNHPIPAEMLEKTAVTRLLTRHAALEDELAERTARPMVDWDGVKLIKRQKLEIAEQIEALKRRMQ